jgi:hypothetical protein
MQALLRDTFMQAEIIRIEDYKSLTRPYEGHFKHYKVHTSVSNGSVLFRRGDWIIPLNQPAARYIIEMLEPTGDDSFFAWNFFDPILQQKEGYSEHRWEQVAGEWLREHPQIREELDARKLADAAFVGNEAAQLEFVYRRSPWYEPVHLRYPVCRIPE